MILTLSWPAGPLWANRKHHWRTVAKARAVQRKEAWALACMEAGFRSIEPARRISVRAVFHPPDNRRRDQNNLSHTIKAAVDGIADAIGIDDSRFQVEATLDPQTRKRGAVVVTVSAMALEAT